MPRFKLGASGESFIVTGNPIEGGTLTVTPSSNFTILAIQWMRDDVEIAGETQDFYNIKPSDVGSTIHPVVKGYGKNRYPIVLVPKIPAIVSIPVISAAVLGKPIEYIDGVFTGTPSPSVVNEWFINGSSVGSITPVAQTVGVTVILAQKAANSAGSVTAYSEPLVVTGNPEDVIFNSAVIVPFTNFLNDGESLVTDGTVDYGARINSALAQLNQEYQLDGKLRQLYFPTGKYKLTAENPTLTGYSGVGLKGDGPYLTVFIPVLSLVTTNSDYNAAGIYHENQLFSDFEVDCSSQVVVQSWFTYKAFFMRRCRLQYYKNILAHESQGTLFGLDFMDRCYFYDCIGWGSGKATSAGSGPGAVFGISIGHEEVEVCEFHRCLGYNGKTASFYFEAVGGATTKPKGVLLKDCIGHGSYIGVDDCGCDTIIIDGGSYYNNGLAGIKWGANSVTSNTKGPINGKLTGGVKIYGNGVAPGSLKSPGGVVFGYACNNGQTGRFDIDDAEIYENVGCGVANYQDIPNSLALMGDTSIHDNYGSGVYLFHRGQVLNNFLVESDVSIKNNGTSNNFEMSDGVTLCCNTTNADIACSGGDDLATHRQSSVVAFRGVGFSATNPKVSGDLTEHVTGSPIRMEHKVIGEFINTATINPLVPKTRNLVNLARNPVALGSQIPSAEYGCTVSITDITNGPDGNTKAFRAVSTNTSTMKMNMAATIASTQIAIGELYCLSFMVKASVAGKTLTSSVITSQSAYGASVSPDLESTGEWQRFSIIGRKKSSTIQFSAAMSKPAVGDYIDVCEVMVTTGPDLFDYFDGTIGGGTWTGTANNSTSTKQVAI